jgi:hypothetical protein
MRKNGHGMERLGKQKPSRREYLRKGFYLSGILILNGLMLYSLEVLLVSIIYFDEPQIVTRQEGPILQLFIKYFWVFGGLLLVTGIELYLCYLGIRWILRRLQQKRENKAYSHPIVKEKAPRETKPIKGLFIGYPLCANVSETTSC